MIDFGPGRWFASTPYGTTPFVEFEVTGELPADLTAVEANATLELIEMSILVSEGALVAGDNVVTIVNNGAQIHFLDIGQVPDGTTHDEVDTLMNSFMTGTPPLADGIQDSDLTMVATFPDMSHAVSVTVPLALEAGTYFLVCWAPDPETGMPHAMMGMWDPVTVE